MKIFLVARMGSFRLPGKHLMKLPNDKYCIQNLIDELLIQYTIEDVILCTTETSADDILVERVTSMYPNINVFRGSELNVLDRFKSCINNFNLSSYFIRINGDNVLIPSALIKSIELIHNTFGYDFTSNTHPTKSLPPGLTVQICNTAFFHSYYEINKNDEYCREHVFRDVHTFTKNYGNIIINQGESLPLKDYALDTIEDFEKITALWS